MDESRNSQIIDYGMNTVMTHTAFGKHAGKALRAVNKEAKRLEKILSRYRPKSEVSRVNKTSGIKNQPLSPETYEVLTSALEFSRLSQGLFDVTIGPLIDLWKEGRAELKPPEESRINQLLPLINYQDLAVDSKKCSAELLQKGQSIDLGGIGKGYAGDKLLEVFKRYDITSAYTNIGGNVAVLGKKPDGSFWRVGIKHPREEDGLIGFVSVSDKAVVTSGDYQRYFMDSKGIRYHHILNPFTGYPAETELISATVIADSSMSADALSTILFAAGREEGLKLLKQWKGTEAILIDRSLKVTITSGLVNTFQSCRDIRVEMI